MLWLLVLKLLPPNRFPEQHWWYSAVKQSFDVGNFQAQPLLMFSFFECCFFDCSNKFLANLETVCCMPESNCCRALLALLASASRSILFVWKGPKDFSVGAGASAVLVGEGFLAALVFLEEDVFFGFNGFFSRQFLKETFVCYLSR